MGQTSIEDQGFMKYLQKIIDREIKHGGKNATRKDMPGGGGKLRRKKSAYIRSSSTQQQDSSKSQQRRPTTFKSLSLSTPMDPTTASIKARAAKTRSQTQSTSQNKEAVGDFFKRLLQRSPTSAEARTFKTHR